MCLLFLNCFPPVCSQLARIISVLPHQKPRTKGWDTPEAWCPGQVTSPTSSFLLSWEPSYSSLWPSSPSACGGPGPNRVSASHSHCSLCRNKSVCLHISVLKAELLFLLQSKRPTCVFLLWPPQCHHASTPWFLFRDWPWWATAHWTAT